MRKTTVAFVAALAVLASPSNAHADETSSPPASEPVVVGGEAIEPGAAATFTFTEGQIERAREAAVDEQQTDGFTGEQQELVDELVDVSEDNGGTLTAGAVDVVELLGGDISLAMPVDIDVTDLTIQIDGTELTAEIGAEPTDDPTISSGGPGMASWGSDGDGQYILKVNGMGDAIFLWNRKKLTGDGNPDAVYYAYRRWGQADPYNIAGNDAKVQRMRLQSYPYDQIEGRLISWTGFKPATDFSGECGSHEVNASFSVFGASIGTTFKDCDKYEVWRNAYNPGSYWIQMDQGFVVHGGPREIGYALGIKADAGTPGSMHDFQRVVFDNSGTERECASYDQSKTCPGYN